MARQHYGDSVRQIDDLPHATRVQIMHGYNKVAQGMVDGNAWIEPDGRKMVRIVFSKRPDNSVMRCSTKKYKFPGSRSNEVDLYFDPLLEHFTILPILDD